MVANVKGNVWRCVFAAELVGQVAISRKDCTGEIERTEKQYEARPSRLRERTERRDRIGRRSHPGDAQLARDVGQRLGRVMFVFGDGYRSEARCDIGKGRQQARCILVGKHAADKIEPAAVKMLSNSSANSRGCRDIVTAVEPDLTAFGQHGREWSCRELLHPCRPLCAQRCCDNGAVRDHYDLLMAQHCGCQRKVAWLVGPCEARMG